MSSQQDRAAPELRMLSINGIDYASYHWPSDSQTENEDKPTLFFLHATGFHARCWDQVIGLLSEFRVIACDQRGHGQSGNEGAFTWQQFGEDVIAALKALGEKNLLGIGHSMGGHALTQAAATEAERFNALLLLDPVIMKPRPKSEAGAAAHIGFRKNDFASADEMFERFKAKLPYSLWQPTVLRDYCDHGLVANGDRFQLACPPDIEASIYGGAGSYDIDADIRAIKCPVSIMRAEAPAKPEEMTLANSPTREDLAAMFSAGEDLYHPELSHYIPMEAPELVADTIREIAQRSSRAS